MDKIARVRQEIERLYDGEAPRHNQQCDFSDGYFTGIGVISAFLDTLSEEPDKSLEEAAEEQAKSFGYMSQDVEFKENVESFIAGTEWQASQMPMPEDTVLFNKGVQEGRRLEREDMMKDGNVILAEEDFDAEKEKSMGWGYNLCKEQMLKDAIHYVVQDDLDPHGASYNVPFIRIGRDALKPKGIGVGDKVRILVLKAEEE